MSASYYFIKERKPKQPYQKLTERLDYEKWVQVMEGYGIVWARDTKVGQYICSTEPQYCRKYKKQAYFDYKERKDGKVYDEEKEVYVSGKYSMFIVFNKEAGYAWAQFYGRERKKLIPLLFEISKKLDCYLFRNAKTSKIVTQEYVDSL